MGDEDQTIYTFTGATSDFLTGFAERYAGARVIELAENYRSSPARSWRSPTTCWPRPGARSDSSRRTRPVPTRRSPATGPRPRELAALARWIRERVADGAAPAEIAVLVRVNAQLAPIEAELTRAEHPLSGARRSTSSSAPTYRGDRPGPPARPTQPASRLSGAIRALWAAKLGYDDDVVAGYAGEEARERTAALDTLLDILGTLTRKDSRMDVDGYLAELDRRRGAERAGSADGVNLLTYHRAKGLEWDAVALPALEEGLLPIRQAFDDDELLAEEGRLLYVGITRARRHLAISWAAERETRGRTTRREPSRFLADLRPRGEHRVTQLPDRFAADQGARQERQQGRGGEPVRHRRRRSRCTPRSVPGGRHVPAPTPCRRTSCSHDQTLAAIADMKPPSAAALRRVKGIGPAKIETYGDEILELVRRLR